MPTSSLFNRSFLLRHPKLLSFPCCLYSFIFRQCFIPLVTCLAIPSLCIDYEFHTVSLFRLLLCPLWLYKFVYITPLGKINLASKFGKKTCTCPVLPLTYNTLSHNLVYKYICHTAYPMDCEYDYVHVIVKLLQYKIKQFRRVTERSVPSLISSPTLQNDLLTIG
jgi:hypothetical protein